MCRASLWIHTDPQSLLLNSVNIKANMKPKAKGGLLWFFSWLFFLGGGFGYRFILAIIRKESDSINRNKQKKCALEKIMMPVLFKSSTFLVFHLSEMH